MRAGIVLCVTIGVIALAGARAQAVTLSDVIELSQAGIGDVVLIELIEMDDVAYPLTPPRLRSLKAAGVSDEVLLALLRSGRSVDGNESAVARRGGRQVTGRSDGCGTGRATCKPAVATIVPVRVLVPARPAQGTGGREPASRPRTVPGFGGVSGSALSTITTGITDTAAMTRREPSYWGWGGKKRPGSWNGHSGASR